MAKPVFDVTAETMWNYEYQAKNYFSRSGLQIIASNSLINLKREIKERSWKQALITTSSGCLSYGQNLVDEYPYIPKY